ncbi:MAG: hypothetical protein ABR599_08055 [Gemmatimonadota bacterium]
MDWFYLYILGFLVVIAGVALGLNLIGVPPVWILLVALLLLVVMAASTLRRPRGSGEP